MLKSRVILIWSIIVILASSAAILTRYCEIPATSIGFWRVFGGGLAFLPLALQVKRHNPGERIFTRGALLAGIFLGLHFASWCWAIQQTTLANAALFIGLQPLMIPFIARFILGERPNAWEKLGIVLALSGTLWLGYNQAAISREDIPGSAMALGSALLCATYMVMSRKYRPGHNAIAFVTGVFLVAAAVQALTALIIDGGIFLGNQKSILAVVGLILFPTIGGHGLSMFLLRYAKSQLMSFTVPAQFVFVALAAVPLFGEIPPWWFYPGAIMIMTGVIVGIARFEH